MNIGYVYGFNSYPPAGGGGVHVYNLVHQLSSLGHNILSFEPEQNPVCETFPVSQEGITEFIEKADLLYVRIDGSLLSHSDLKLQCMNAIGSKPIFWEVNSPTDEILARLRFQALSFQGLSNPILNKLKNSARDYLFRRSVGSEEKLRRAYGKIVCAALCVSEPLRLHAQRDLGISRCVVVPNGSDPDLFSNQEPMSLGEKYTDYYKVIYAGASQWFWQNVDVIEKLAGMAQERDDKILFILLDNSAAKHDAQLHPNVLAVNQVNYFDVGRYLATADACLCLYHDFSWSRHGFYLSPLKLYDYMASGKPVIASRLGQIAAVIEDGIDGLLVSNDPEEIYERILYCKSSSTEAIRLGLSAQQKVNELYNWKRVAECTINTFETVMPG